MLNSLICFISNCILELIFILCFKILTNSKEKIHWRYIILIPIFSGIITIENNFALYPLTTLSSILASFILYKMLFKYNLNKTIYYGIAIYILAILVDIIITIISLIGTKYFSTINIDVLRGIATLILDITLIGICKIKKMNKIINLIYKKLTKVRFPYLRISIILCILISLGFTLFYIFQGKNISEIQIFLYLLTISIIILIMIYINKEYENYTLKETNDYLIKNNEFYINVVNDYRILKHNIIHQLNGIKSVSNKKTISLIDDLIEQYNENETEVQNIKKMPVGISGIVYEKIYSFNNKEIKLGIDNSIESNIFNNLTPRSYNLLCEALGILIDNALQATSKTEDKIIMIDMKENELYYQIKVINTFKDLLEIEKLGTIKYSTKNSSGHGIGLFSLIGRRKLKIKTSIVNDLFLNEITIEKHLN